MVLLGHLHHEVTLNARAAVLLELADGRREERDDGIGVVHLLHFVVLDLLARARGEGCLN